MTNRLLFSLLLAMCGVLPANSQTVAVDAKQAVLIIQHDGSEGQVRVNGVLILHFASDPTLGKGSLTDSLGTFSTYAKDGPNVVTLEARPETGRTDATTTVSAIVATGALSDLDKPLFQETITGSGKLEKTIVLKNVPQWAFLQTQPFTGNKDEVLAAVRSLHKALADHDSKAVGAVLKPMYDDLLAYVGEAALGSPGEFQAHTAEMANDSKLEPLPADLKVEGGYGDRLFIVTTASGKAPIQLASKKLNEEGHPDWTMQTGSYWIHRPDGWFLIRQ